MVVGLRSHSIRTSMHLCGFFSLGIAVHVWLVNLENSLCVVEGKHRQVCLGLQCYGLS